MTQEIHTENWRKKLKFRCWHRGTKEMDIILGRFADEYVQKFDVDQLQEFEDMLAVADPDLYNWLTKKEQPPRHIKNSVLELFLSSNS